MLRYKGFDSAQCADDMARFEVSVNDWLQLQLPHIRMMAQSARGEHVVVSFLYDGGEDVVHDEEARVSPEMLQRYDEEDDLDGGAMEDTRLPEAELPY